MQRTILSKEVAGIRSIRAEQVVRQTEDIVETRRIRAEQDQEYQESLLVDREKVCALCSIHRVGEPNLELPRLRGQLREAPFQMTQLT